MTQSMPVPALAPAAPASSPAAELPLPPLPPSRLEALTTDPVIRYYQASPTLLRTRLALRLVANVIVATVLDDGPAALAGGLQLLLSCFRRPQHALGTDLCRRTYRRVIKEAMQAKREDRVRFLRRLATLYSAFCTQGVPKDICDEGRKTAGSPAERARLLSLGDEDGAAAAKEVGRCLLNAETNQWFIQRPDGEWAGPFSDSVFKTMLCQAGYASRIARERFIAETDSFEGVSAHDRLQRTAHVLLQRNG